VNPFVSAKGKRHVPPRGDRTGLALRGIPATMVAVSITIAPATPDDLPTILSLIRELAEYEKLLDRVTATEGLLRQTLFGPRPYAEVLIARVERRAVGYALFFHTCSTFLARPGMYLEDVYVQPAFRGRGVGKALLAEVARVSRDRGCGRLEWAVLNWNTPAIEFYQSLGAQPMEGWTTYRMDERAIAKLAE
jgi:GNAT superfamily N-acetyltransferase